MAIMIECRGIIPGGKGRKEIIVVSATHTVVKPAAAAGGV